MPKKSRNELMGMLLIIGGSVLLLLALAPFVVKIALGFVGYKMLDAGLYMSGYPPVSYWISWVRAQLRL